MSSICLAANPALARIESNTGDLLELLSDSGIRVVVNGESCNRGYHGSYVFAGMQRTVNLCPGEFIDAEDHDTVRHETMHAIQHCVNTARGTALNTSVLSPEDLAEMINRDMPASRVAAIKEAYPVDAWLVEFEAFWGADVFTATELMDMFRTACLAE